jgi:hypothetical protein
LFLNLGEYKNMLLDTYLEHLRRPLTYVISSSRRNIVVKFIARACKEFLNAYHNVGASNPETNGEKYVLETIAKSGESCDCIIDVGANKGYWALPTAKFFPSATIHSFEIISETAELMKKTHLIQI